MINTPRKNRTSTSTRAPRKRSAKRFIPEAPRQRRQGKTEAQGEKVAYQEPEQQQPFSSGNDEQLKKEIQDAIEKDDTVPVSVEEIDIVVSNGMVVLKGDVLSDEEKMTIGDKAIACAGFGKVINQLEVAESEE